MKTLFFFSLIGVVLLFIPILPACSDFSPAQSLSQFAGDWRGIFGADSASLNLSASSKDAVKGEAVFWNDSLRTVGAFDGVVDRHNIEFSISLPAFSIDGKGAVSREEFIGDFKKWLTVKDEFGMPHILNRGGGNFALERKSS